MPVSELTAAAFWKSHSFPIAIISLLCYHNFGACSGTLYSNHCLTFHPLIVERIFAIIYSSNTGTTMFNIEFYSTADGISEIWDFLDDLQKKYRVAKLKKQRQNAMIGF